MSMDSFTTPANAPGTAERPRICGESATLPTHLVLKALRYAHRPDIGPDDIRDVRCTLQVHDASEHHYGFIVDTAPATAAWTRWTQDTVPQIVLVLPDCPATDPGQDRVCSEYEGHRGGHTWQVEDPWNSRDVTVTGA